jgi:hypothetical protein
MKKATSILKVLLKVILWTTISIILLFITIAILIQIPFIQIKVVHFATSFISNKTHTKVEIKKISIAFPKSIVIEGIYLEDLKKDTLLYAGEAKVNIAFRDLFNQEIHVSSFSLEDVNLKINRIKSDSLYNFDFLMAAFSDTTKKKIVEPKTDTASKWTFGVDKISLKNIKVNYKDDFGGINAAVNLKHLTLKMDKMDLAKLNFSADELSIDSLTGNILVKQSFDTTQSNSGGASPLFAASKIQITNTNLSYGDSINKQSVIAKINQLKLNTASVDIAKQNVSFENVSLSKSKITYNTYSTTSTDTVVAAKKTTEPSNWIVSVKNINLEDNSLAYQVVNKPEIKNTFDASHLDYKQVNLAAINFYYSSLKTEVSISKFSAIDKNNYAITQFETDFKMDQNSITTKNLKVRTSYSFVDADLQIKFASLKSLIDIQHMVINANMRNVIFRNSDIVYFSPDLIKQDFFKNTKNITSVSGVVNGPINNLYGKNLLVRTGFNTVVKTDFNIAGLPNILTAYYNFPNLKIISGNKDISMMTGALIPKSIELPENLNMDIIFKGKIKAFESTIALKSSYGSADVFATIDKNENFSSKVAISNFNLGVLLKDTAMFGPVTLTANANGHGLDIKTITAKIKVDASQIYLNKYAYHNLKVNGAITGMQFEGKINLKDENAVFDFDGLVNLNPNEEKYKFQFNLQGADLKKLHLSKDDLKIGLIAVSDLKGGAVNKINGSAGITKIIVAHEGKTYILDSVLIASINEKNKSELNVRSSIVAIKYSGAFSPFDLPKELSLFINNYFQFSDSIQQKSKNELTSFNFEIQVRNHPMLSEVFFPELKEMEPLLIQGGYDSLKNELKLNATLKKIVYGTTELRDIVLIANSDENAFNYKISSSNISNSTIKFDNLLVDGKLANNTLFANVSSIDEKLNKKLLIRSQISKNEANYKLILDPKDFYLMNNRWDIASDNYIEFGKQGFLIHHLFLNKTESQINISSVHDKFNDDINIEIKNFKLEDVSGIIEKDSSLVKGSIDGTILLKRVNKTYGIIADAQINKLFFQGVPIGNLTLKADNPTSEKFDINVNLSGANNTLTASGYFLPKGGDNSINIKADIKSLSMNTVKAFSFGNISEASGDIFGTILIDGRTTSPDITGELTFNHAMIKPAALNNKLLLIRETVQIKKDGIYFNKFTAYDSYYHSAVINGAVKMKQFKNFVFDLNVNSKDFLLFNTTVKDNKEYYGRMIVDSKIDISGPITLPVVNAKIKIKKGSNFTFAVPEDKLSTDKGEDVVKFEDTLKVNPILKDGKIKEIQKSSLTGFDVYSVIEVEKEATLRLLIDPTTNDSLVVKGEAALSFTIDRSGKMSLTGAYNLSDGSYLVSLESVIKRKFKIEAGSTIIWNGDPLDANISINAIYEVRAAPIDLVADQMAGISETDKSAYKQRYPFIVLLKLRGELLHPEISFEIQLPPEEKGILGGAVNAKLNLLNEDQSALNKQVFALLVLGRFTQENPLQSETNGAAMVVRTTVGKLLSQQLNQFSSKVVPGVELNFDIQSYDDYQTGTAVGRTQVDIGVKKQLFNERLSVQIGGVVDVEGEKAKQNSTSDITSDITVEYKLTKDGRYRLKGFRHNQYEGAIEGQLVETGVGVSYVRDFDKWKFLFRSPTSKSDSLKTTTSNDTIKIK